MVNRGGKVLRKSASPEKAEKKSEDADGDVKMSEAGAKVDDTTTDGDAAAATKPAAEQGDDDKAKKDADAKKSNDKTSAKSFAVTPVPSFHYQDLKRIRILQNDMVQNRNSQLVREKVQLAQAHYERAYKKSIDIQQVKATALSDYNKMIEQYKREEAHAIYQGNLQLSSARGHWERRQHHNMKLEATLGKDKALARSVSNEILQDIKDRVCIRASDELSGSGLGTHRLEKAALKAKSEGDEGKEASAIVLGHIIDGVERRHGDMLANHHEFVPPNVCNPTNVIADPETGETMREMHARKVVTMKRRIQELDAAFKIAEKKRGEAWVILSKAKASPQQQTSSSSRRSRQSTASRQSYPVQQQQQYYQQQQQRVPANSAASIAAAAVQQSAANRVTQMMSAAVQAGNQAQLAQMQQAAQQMAVRNALLQQQMGAQVPSGGASFHPVQRPAPAASSVAAVAVGNTVAVAQGQPQPAAFAAAEQSAQPAVPAQKTTQLAKYGYGDRYSTQNVNARKNADGTVFPVSQPKLLPDGKFARPSGRQRKGMDWDADRGCWYPAPGGQQSDGGGSSQGGQQSDGGSSQGHEE